MNALIVTVDHTPASRQQATSAAYLAASMNRPLHLVFGTGPRVCCTITNGSDRFLFDSDAVAESVLANLKHELRSITTITQSIVAKSPSAALRKEAKRLGASPVVLSQGIVARVATRIRPEARRPVQCPARPIVSIVSGA
jgi:hypothetical protein